MWIYFATLFSVSRFIVSILFESILTTFDENNSLARHSFLNLFSIWIIELIHKRKQRQKNG